MIRAASARLTPGARAEAAADLVPAVLAAAAEPPVVVGYHAMLHELDVGPALRACRARGQAVALPRCTGPGRMRLLMWGSDAVLTRDAAGVPAPPADAPAVGPDDAAAVLVPGLAFDAADHVRLGLGGGYYDRLLAQHHARWLTLGIAFPHQVVPDVPRDPWDAAVDCVLVGR